MAGGVLLAFLGGAVKVALDQANKQKKTDRHLAGERYPAPQERGVDPENESPWTYHPPS
jgi:hypothetical protein